MSQNYNKTASSALFVYVVARIIDCAVCLSMHAFYTDMNSRKEAVGSAVNTAYNSHIPFCFSEIWSRPFGYQLIQKYCNPVKTKNCYVNYSMQMFIRFKVVRFNVV